MTPIDEAIQRLRQLTQIDVQKNWRLFTGKCSPSSMSGQSGQEVTLNQRGHIAWSSQTTIGLAQTIEVPPSLQGYSVAGLSLRLVLRWWAEDAEIYVNHQLVQTGDLFDCSTRVLLSPSVKIGDKFHIFLGLVSPQHDAGALVCSSCVYEATEPLQIDPGFLADELEIITINITHSPTLEAERSQLLQELITAVERIDWSALPDSEKFNQSLSTLRHHLIQSNRYNSTAKMALLGHAHLDLAWLWPIKDTWDAAQRTFESVLYLQQDFANLIFCHSTPALYAWIEQHRPDLFQQIQQQVAARRWEITAGLWVEPELNIISGESIVRQVLYGQRYVAEKFGEISAIAWLPDSFGFCWQLPQILKQAGIEYFVTQKLRWNDTTSFPHEVFWWESPDGSRILSWMSSPIGVGIEPVNMTRYAVEWQAQTGFKTAFWLPGVGDHGGGPTRDMLEVAQRWQQSPFLPQLAFSRAVDYLRQIESESDNLPIWQDELYLEFHRGCYTTHAAQKQWNRQSEVLLYQAELWASLAMLHTGAVYPKAEIETAWKQVLFNQFHDILPGTAIAEVYLEANQLWQAATHTAQHIRQTALDAIASSVPLPTPPQPDAQPLLVFNPLNWSRSQVVSWALPATTSAGRIYDTAGNLILTQLRDNKLWFHATRVPSVGYRVFWFCAEEGEILENSTFQPSNVTLQAHLYSHYTVSVSDPPKFVNPNFKSAQNWVLENEFLRVEVEAETGNIGQILDKINQREVLSKTGGNHLQFFQDQGQYWDAWNIDPNYTQHLLNEAKLEKIEWQEQGLILSRLRVIRTWGKSEFCHDYILEAGSVGLKIETTVNWQDRHVLVKAGFSFNFAVDFAACEIPCGVMQRPTRLETEYQKAKWEIPAMNWVDLGDETYGVAVLNTGKYGYDIQPDKIRLTLLRGSTWPDPNADLGTHQFTYEIYPHVGSWKQAKVVHRGYELNQPLEVRSVPENSGVKPNVNLTKNSLDARSFLEISSDSLVLMAFKPAEENLQSWILRVYECQGQETRLELNSDGKLAIARAVNLLEQPIDQTFSETERNRIEPWKIASFQISQISDKLQEEK